MRLIMTIGVAVSCAGVSVAGDLNPPPGPVAPSLKALDEVEPRIAMSAENTPGDADSVFRIDASGSYYLTGTLTGESGKRGIEIDADGVTIDLNGFSIEGAPGALQGVLAISGTRQLTIRNGHIRGFEIGGLSAQGTTECLIENLTCVMNGTTSSHDGINVGSYSVIRGCVASENSGDGINAGEGCVVSHCASRENGFWGIVASRSTITDCTATRNGLDGIFASFNSTVESCTSTFNEDDGIDTSDETTVINCNASRNEDDGIAADGGCAVIGCLADTNSGDGIEIRFFSVAIGNTCRSNGAFGGDGAGVLAIDRSNRVDGNTVLSNTRGIEVNGTGNIVVRNSATENNLAYSVVAGNAVGTIQASPVGAGPWDNFSY